MENLQYPIGKFDADKNFSLTEIEEAKVTLAEFPAKINALTSNLSDQDLAKIYRPEGWCVRQIVHHVADSHANMYIRLKCALTEDNPTIKGYSEEIWAELADSKLPIEPSLKIIEGLHLRIVSLIDSMDEADFDKTYFHNGYNRTYKIGNVFVMYAWHSLHHLEHIKIALKND